MFDKIQMIMMMKTSIIAIELDSENLLGENENNDKNNVKYLL